MREIVDKAATEEEGQVVEVQVVEVPEAEVEEWQEERMWVVEQINHRESVCCIPTPTISPESVRSSKRNRSTSEGS